MTPKEQAEQAARDWVEYTDPDNLCADFRCRSEYAIPVVRVEALLEYLDELAEEYFQQGNTQARLAIEKVEQLLAALEVKK